MTAARRDVIGLRTKMLSDEVYEALNRKSKTKNELPTYINRLVKADLQQQQQSSREDVLIALMQEMRQELSDLRELVMLRPVGPIGYQEVPYQPVIEVEDDLKEGQLVDEKEVTGTIEEEIEVDL